MFSWPCVSVDSVGHSSSGTFCLIAQADFSTYICSLVNTWRVLTPESLLQGPLSLVCLALLIMPFPLSRYGPVSSASILGPELCG